MASQQPTAALPNKLAQAAYEEAWPQKWLDKLTAAILSRDRKTVRRIKFGRRICELRFLLDMSQAEAADAAHEMDRGQWNRIENAKHIPYDETVIDMAHALRVDPAGLLRLAARVVPQTLYVYDKNAAMRDCGNALRMSDTQVEWLTRCQQIWQKYYLDQTGATVDIKMELSFSEIVEFVYQYLGRKQQLKLARRLIRQHPLDEAKKYLETPERLLEEVEKQLEGEMSDGERFLRSYDEASAAINAFMDRIENLRNDPQVWLNRIEDAVKLIPEKRKRSAYNSFALLRRPKRRKSWLPTLVDHPAFTTTRQ